MIHRGKIIDTYVRSKGINFTKLAEKLPWTVKTMYRHFENEDLDLEKILEYSAVLKHDFSDEIPEMNLYKFTLSESHAPWQKKDNQSEADYYRNKYEVLLEKYNEMLEQYNKLLQRRDVPQIKE